MDHDGGLDILNSRGARIKARDKVLSAAGDAGAEQVIRAVSAMVKPMADWGNENDPCTSND